MTWYVGMWASQSVVLCGIDVGQVAGRHISQMDGKFGTARCTAVHRCGVQPQCGISLVGPSSELCWPAHDAGRQNCLAVG